MFGPESEENDSMLDKFFGFRMDWYRAFTDNLKNCGAHLGRLESFFGASTIKSSTKRKEPETKGKATGKGRKAAKK